MKPVAFDDRASGYDAVAESALGRTFRARVHDALSLLIKPGDTVVDLGCGTGLDAAWLAPQVASVISLDASPEMADVARDRCDVLANVTISIGHGASFDVDQPVDVVLANFGVVNCVGDLAEFGTRLFENAETRRPCRARNHAAVVSHRVRHRCSDPQQKPADPTYGRNDLSGNRTSVCVRRQIGRRTRFRLHHGVCASARARVATIRAAGSA